MWREISSLVFTLVILMNPRKCEGACDANTTVPVPSLTVVNRIVSPLYPDPYTPFQFCQWNVQAPEVGQNVMFYVEYESLEFEMDTVSVFSVAKKDTRIYYSALTPAQHPTGVTTTRKMEVLFMSDGSKQFGGFSIAYMAVTKTSQPSCSSAVTLTTTPQQFTYLTSMGACTWNLRTSNSGNLIEYIVRLVHGYVRITEGGANTDVSVYGATAHLTATSRASLVGISGNDFVIEMKEAVPPPTTLTPPTALSTTPMATTTTPVVVDLITSDAIDVCGETVELTATDTPQYITSPNYPDPYSSDLSCSVVIQSSSDTGSIHLEIVDLDLELEDTLIIVDGPSSEFPPISPIVDGAIFNSTGSTISIYFTTDSYSSLRGFKLRFYNVSRSIPECAMTYTAYDVNTTIQTFTSPNFPGQYPLNQNIYWLFIKPRQTDNIVVKFTNVDLEDSETCSNDYVDVFDGPCPEYQRLVHICGSDTVTVMDNSGLYVLMYFRSDTTVTYNGFSVQVYIDANANQDDGQTDDDGGLPVYAYVLIGIGIALLLAIIIVIVAVILLRRQRKKEASKPDGVDTKEPPMIRFSTATLLTGLIEKSKIIKEKVVKAKRKQRPGDVHPPPNTDGPGVKVYRMSNPPLPTSSNSKVSTNDTTSISSSGDENRQQVPPFGHSKVFPKPMLMQVSHGH